MENKLINNATIARIPATFSYFLKKIFCTANMNEKISKTSIGVLNI